MQTFCCSLMASYLSYIVCYVINHSLLPMSILLSNMTIVMRMYTFKLYLRTKGYLKATCDKILINLIHLHFLQTLLIFFY